MERMRARSRVGEPIELGVTPDGVVVRGAAGDEHVARTDRPILTIEVSAPRLALRPGLRLPRGGLRGRIVWFDSPAERDRAVAALARAGWAVRPRRWPFVIGMVAFLALAAASLTVQWLLAVFLLACAGGCLLHLVRNVRGAAPARASRGHPGR